jgi:hypothetical protein
MLVRAPSLKHRRRTVYTKYFARHDLFPARPTYFDMPANCHLPAIRSDVLKRIARFHMCSHHLGVVTGIWTYNSLSQTNQIDE